MTGRPGRSCARRRGRFASPHARHDHVGHQQVEVRILRTRGGEIAFAVLGSRHAEPRRLRRPVDELPHRAFVLDDEHRVSCRGGRGRGGARVDDEGEQHLLDPAAVHQDVQLPGVEARLERDVPADQPAQQVAHELDGLVQVDRLRIQPLAPAVGGQLPGESGGACGCVHDLFGVPEGGRVRLQTGAPRLGVPADRSEEVLEIVRSRPRRAPFRVRAAALPASRGRSSRSRSRPAAPVRGRGKARAATAAR